MTRLGRAAERQLDSLIEQYESIDRPEAVRNLLRTMQLAADRIDRFPGAGLSAPRPYPDLAGAGRRWIKIGRYWIAYVTADGLCVISGVFHDSADIPNRI